MAMQEYKATTVVRARKLKDTGENIVTTAHGTLTVFGGYLVRHRSGISEYMTTEEFESKFAPKEDEQEESPLLRRRTLTPSGSE